MTFDDILAQIVDVLQRQGRLSYGAIKRRFGLDDAYLDDLKDELIHAQHVATDEDGKVLVWTGTPPEPTAVSAPSVSRESVPPPTHPPDAERRQLTVLFCDLVDSTKLSGQLDPEEYRDVLRAYQSTCAAVIHRFDGYIAQHLGDALLVYFGYPQAHEDDAQRAIHAALGMLEAMQGLNGQLQQDKGIRLAIRVGMRTGLTVVGDIGAGPKHELLALGEAPNIAARVQGIAQSDTVAISAATYRLVQGYFVCDDLGMHTLKGVAEPVQIYRVLRASGAQSRLERGALSGLTPLVGRDTEVTLLRERWSQAQEGYGQVVVLSGEAGIGKSRLVQVLRESVQDAAHTWLACRCLPYYQHTAFYPVTELLQRVLHWQHDAAPDQADAIRKPAATAQPSSARDRTARGAARIVRGVRGALPARADVAAASTP